MFLPLASACIAALLFNACRDITFNNPLDPDASRANLTIQNVFSTQVSGPGDICFDGEKIWKASDRGNATAFDTESGATIRSFLFAPSNGIAFLNRRLYLCGQENQINVFDPLSGTLITRISTAEIYPRLLAAGMDELLVFDSRSESVFTLDPESLEIRRLFQLPGLETGGMEFFGDSLLVSDLSSNALYRLTLAGSVEDVFRSPLESTAGVCKDDRGFLYLMSLNGQVAKVTLP
jgi:hypothetical protein